MPSRFGIFRQCAAACWATFILKALDLEIGPSMLRQIVRDDPLAQLQSTTEALQRNVQDLFSLGDGTVAPHSSIVSRFLLSRLTAPADLTDWLLSAARVAAQRKATFYGNDDAKRQFREAVHVLGRVLTVSRLRELLGAYDGCDDEIETMFERGRRDETIDAEPLFWLQYAILIARPDAAFDDLNRALGFIDTAYQRAALQPDFETYQVETYHLRLLILVEGHDDNSAPQVADWPEWLRLFGRFQEMLRNDNHRDHVVRVLEMIERLVDKRGAAFAAAMRRDLVAQLGDIASAMEMLPQQARVSSGSDAVRLSLLRCIEKLTSGRV